MTDRMDITSSGQPAAPFSEIMSLVRAFGAKIALGFHAVQLARVKSILSRMSDRQLAEIGIKRSEISQYATKLMALDSDH
mgnify:CR=1 FL=1|tara:strand:+ start:1432 stop:1671 length:240 start_codon:yes stop_codon:yes gene_type:complete